MTTEVALSFALALLTAAAGGDRQQPTFTTRIEAVRVDVLVTRDGRPIRDLTAADFEVLDNGVRQHVDLVSFEQNPLNVVLVLDTSDSLAGEPMRRLRRAGAAVLDGLRPGDQAALLTFSHVVGPGLGLTADFKRVRRALEEARPGGHTALIDATYAGMMIGESDVGRSLLIAFSDGVDTSSWLAADAVLETARRSDVVMYGVSADAGGQTFLKDLARATGGSLLAARQTDDLRFVFVSVLEEFRQRYLVSYSPQGVPKDGWHRIDVRVRVRGATVKARPGYLAGF